jgi:hypothetical protein
MLQVFNTKEEYDKFIENDPILKSGILYYIKEDNSGHFATNNIEDEYKIYDIGGGDTEDDRIVAIFRKVDNQGNNSIIGMYVADYIDEIEIDGVKQESIQQSVTLSQGNHVIKYKLKNNTVLPENMFSGCSNLISVTLPSTITKILATAFSSCEKLTSININNNLGDKITFIGNDAFYYCKLLASIIISSPTPPSTGNSIFDSSYVPKIYVPADKLDTYKAAKGWSKYADNIQAIP